MRKFIIVLALTSLLIGGACSVKRPTTNGLGNLPASDTENLPNNLPSLEETKSEETNLNSEESKLMVEENNSSLEESKSSLKDDNQEISDSDEKASYDATMLFTEWEEKNKKIGRSGRTIYPDWYGGCYQDSNGFLVMQCTDIDKINLLPEGSKYVICKYSYNKLDSIKHIIKKRAGKVNKSIGSNVRGYSISGKYNILCVMLSDTSDEKIEEFKKYLYPDIDCIMFNKLDSVWFPKSPILP